MHSLSVAIGPVFLVVFFGLVAYSNRRRRARWREHGHLTPPQSGPSEWSDPATAGMDHGQQPPFNSPPPQPPTLGQPGLFRMITPSRPTKVLFGVAASLIVAGFVVVFVIANRHHSGPVPETLLISVVALVGSGGLLLGGLVLAAFLRQGNVPPPQGWPPR